MLVMAGVAPAQTTDRVAHKFVGQLNITNTSGTDISSGGQFEAYVEYDQNDSSRCTLYMPQIKLNENGTEVDYTSLTFRNMTDTYTARGAQTLSFGSTYTDVINTDGTNTTITIAPFTASIDIAGNIDFTFTINQSDGSDTDSANTPLTLAYTGSDEGIVPVGVTTVNNDAQAPVQYYSMQGVQIANPESGHGIYICRQGSKVWKEMH